MKLLKFFIPIFLLILFLVYYFFNGVPGGKSSYERKFKTYLEEKYHEEFVIDRISFDALSDGTYHAYAYPMSEPELEFYIGQLRGTKEISDSYMTAVWDKQAENELTPLLTSLFPDRTSHLLQVYPEPGSDSFKIEGDFPHFKDHVPIHLYLSLEHIYITDENKRSEFERVYSLLSSIQDQEIRIDLFQMTYQNKIITITSSHDMKSISAPNELENYLIIIK